MKDPDYRKLRRAKNHPFNFELTDEVREKLRAVATYRCISMGSALRQMIQTAYAMQLDGRPTCSNGQDCFMPHLHQSTRPTHTQEDPRS